MGDARSNNEVVGLVALKHFPHRLDVIGRPTPIAADREVAESKPLSAAGADPRRCRGDPSAHKAARGTDLLDGRARMPCAHARTTRSSSSVSPAEPQLASGSKSPIAQCSEPHVHDYFRFLKACVGPKAHARSSSIVFVFDKFIPAPSNARRIAVSLANVTGISPSTTSARRIVATPTFEARARSSAVHRMSARAARIRALEIFFDGHSR
jgi:hypothetical protein